MEANVAMPGLLADARLPLPATQLSSDDLSRAALGTLERLDCGWMAAEPGGRIFHMNTAARRMAVRGWLDPCNSGLRALIRDAAATGVGADMALPRRSGRPLAISVLPPLEPAFGAAGLLIILASDPDEPPKIDARRIAVYWKLTRAESALAAELARGLDLAAAAKLLRVTRITARNHLRSILQKTGAHRQSELVRLLMTAPPRLLRNDTE